MQPVNAIEEKMNLAGGMVARSAGALPTRRGLPAPLITRSGEARLRRYSNA